MRTDVNTGLMPPAFLHVSLQDDHKLTLDELHRKYGTDLNNVSEIKRGNKLYYVSVFECVLPEMCYTCSFKSHTEMQIWQLVFLDLS